MSIVKMSLECEHCGKSLPTAMLTPDAPQASCPECGSSYQKVKIEISDEVSIEAHDLAKIKGKDPSLSNKKRERIEVIAGEEPSKSAGGWVDKERMIDRDKNFYKERVVNKSTGEILRDVEELLTEHFAHGSAKAKNQE